MSTIHILMVENDATYSKVVKQTLEQGLDCVVHVAPLLAQAIKKLKRRRFYVVLLNLELPDSSGPDTFHAINSAWPNTSIVALVGPDFEDTEVELLLKSGAKACLPKATLAKQQLLDIVTDLATPPSSSPHFKQDPSSRADCRPKD